MGILWEKIIEVQMNKLIKIVITYLFICILIRIWTKNKCIYNIKH